MKLYLTWMERYLLDYMTIDVRDPAGSFVAEDCGMSLCLPQPALISGHLFVY